jgi:hypothetical protein
MAGDIILEREQMLNMDTFILLSIINMKLRDQFDSLNRLCEDYGIERQELCDKLKSIEYVYSEKRNQFILE